MNEGFAKEDKSTEKSIEERKFIPLINFENYDEFVPLSGGTESPESQKTTTEKDTTHIQRIPHTTASSKVGSPEARSVLFPYVYERKNDPRTRYIPLIPEEDLSIPKSLMERDR